MSRVNLGKVVSDGAIRYLSPSSLTTGDSGSYGGCHRRWWYKYVCGKPEPTTKAQQAGTDLHAEIENYLQTGQRAFGALALTGLNFIPVPGPKVLAEVATIAGVGELAAPRLSVAGVPVLAYFDVLNTSGVNYGAANVGEDHDPNTAEYLDWKTTGQAPGALKSAEEIAGTIQMTIGGVWLAREHPEHVRLSHVYFFTGKSRGPARKISRRMPTARVLDRWPYVESCARALVDVAKIPLDAAGPAGNTKSCDAYGGCPHRAYCADSRQGTIARAFGPGKIDTVSILNMLSGLPAPTRAPGPTPAKETSALEKEIARLRAKEAASKEVATRETREVLVTPAFTEAIRLLKAPRDVLPGMPMLTGLAAELYAVAEGLPTKGPFNGSGLLGEHTVSDPDQLIEVANEIAGMTVTITAEVATTIAAIPPVAVIAESEMPALLPPDAPESVGAAANVEPAKKRGRKTKETTPIAPEDLPVSPRAVAGELPALSVFVDCYPSIPTESLNRRIDDICRAICDNEGEIDIRCGKSEGKLGFGRWKGVLAGLIREAVAGGQIPTGAYTLEVRGNEVAEVAADAIRGVCDLYVRGAR